jgi:lysophospholipase L1-like esterase
MVLDDEIGYVPRPDADVVFEHSDSNTRYHAFTDQRGARVDRPGEQTPARVDVMVLGCSFTWGFGVPNEDTYTEQLKARLGVTAVNLGMGGYSSIQCLQRMRRNLDLRPKFVVFGFVVHQLDRNVSACAATPPTFCLPQPYFEDGDGLGHIRPAGAPLIDAEPMHLMTGDWGNPLDALRAATWALRSDVFRATVRPDQSPAAMVASIRFVIAEMAQAARGIGAQLVVLHIPFLTNPPERPPGFLLQAAAESDAALVDLTPAVAAHYRAQPRVPLTLTPEDAHPNAAGHRLIADQLAAYLQANVRPPDAAPLR